MVHKIKLFYFKVGIAMNYSLAIIEFNKLIGEIINESSG